jgi:hypothetical protein
MVALTTLDRVRVARLVDHQLPEAPPRAGGPEVLEVEGEDRQVVTLGYRHDGGVREAEVQIGEAGVDLDRSAQQPGGEMGDSMLAGRQGREEEARCVWSNSRTQKLVGLDDHRDGDEELTPETSHELGGDAVGLVAPVGCGEQRPGVRDNLQLAGTKSAR